MAKHSNIFGKVTLTRCFLTSPKWSKYFFVYLHYEVSFGKWEVSQISGIICQGLLVL